MHSRVNTLDLEHFYFGLQMPWFQQRVFLYYKNLVNYILFRNRFLTMFTLYIYVLNFEKMDKYVAIWKHAACYVTDSMIGMERFSWKIYFKVEISA